MTTAILIGFFVLNAVWHIRLIVKARRLDRFADELSKTPRPVKLTAEEAAFVCLRKALQGPNSARPFGAVRGEG